MVYNLKTSHNNINSNMLGFTHNSKTSTRQALYDQPDFQPIIIHSTEQRQKKMPQPKIPQKKIIKTHSNNKITNKQVSVKSTKPHLTQQKQWNTGYIKSKEGVFDRQLKRDSLAAQERRDRAKSKRKTDEKMVHRQILSKEEELFLKRAQQYEQQKDKEIQHLKKLIEKEQQQKQKNDRIYELKKQQIEKQRRELLELEKRIQKQGTKAQKIHQQKLKQISPEKYPANDRAKCRQDVQNLPRNLSNFPQITQSQSIANQKNQIRQKQLEYLIDQREKNHLQYQRNTLGYTPTLIPLLSKASYKIISTHVTSLVELFIDDLLQEQVLLLEKIELEEAERKEANKQKQMLTDYVNNLEDFVEEAGFIESKVGRYSKLKFEDMYKPERKIGEFRGSSFEYSNPLAPMYYNLNLNLNHESLEEINERVRRFHRFVENFAQYKPEQMKAMKDVTENIIDEAIEKLVKQLDNGAGQFVNIIFRGQFQ